MHLQDLAFPDAGRLLQGTNDRTIDEASESPFHNNGFCLFAALGMILMVWFYCCVRRSARANGDGNTARVATVLPSFSQDEREAAGYTIHSSLAQRKRAILEIFRTTQVTMKVIDEDIKGATKTQSNEQDLESGDVADGTLAFSRAAATIHSNACIPNDSFSAPPETAPNVCAICLESYQSGEVVVWSCSCKHVFHQDCIAQYLSKKMIGGETPCPSCRQTFFEWPSKDPTVKKP